MSSTTSAVSLTVNAPPTSCPHNLSGLYKAVAKMNALNTEPSTVKIRMWLSFLHGKKLATNAMVGLAIALRVTAKW